MPIPKEYNSIKVTRFILKIVGFWDAESRKEKIILDCCKVYSIQAIFGAIITQIMEFFISNDNISVSF